MGQEFGIPVYVPSPPLTTDNAAMIAAAAYPKLKRGERSGWDLTAEPNLRLSTVDARRTTDRALRRTS
jgi:N6-L-threonylcarbamoyladenine synthase